MIANLSNQELYEKYGITAVSVGEPEQPLFLTKYTVKEVLRCQHPKAVLLDSRNFFYTEKRVSEKINEDEEYFLHYSLDTIDSPQIKKEALEQAGRYKEIDEKEYYLRIYNRHAQWKNLNVVNFKDCREPNCINGNLMLTGLYNVADVTMIRKTISKENEWEIAQIKEECEKHGADLILMTAYIDPRVRNRDQLRELARKLQIDYIDINDMLDEIGFEGNLLHDYVHFNIIGATIWSDWLGQYLTKRYSFGNPSGKLNRLYQDQSKLCSTYKNCVRNKIKFTNHYSFKEFLREIAGSDLKNIVLFAAVCEDAYSSLDEEGKNLLRQIGLDGLQCVGGSFAGVCGTDGITLKKSDCKTVTVSGSRGVLTYVVESAGANCENEPGASVLVNKEEYAKGQRGLNFVLFDEKLGQLIASKCFDTSAESDPGES